MINNWKNIKAKRGALLKSPNLFSAALTDDISEMKAAINDGQSLSSADEDQALFTPIHVAALSNSLAFLEAARLEPTFDPWLRDANDRLAFDHANAFNNKEAMKLLVDEMYTIVRKPDNGLESPEI